MAHFRRNPDLFGEDIIPIAWMAGGLGLTALVNDKLAHPVVSNVVPTGDNTMGKAVDAATTALTAWLLGEAVKMVDNPVAKLVKRGGLLLAIGKVISIPLPSFSISAKFPDLPLPGLRLAPAPAPAQLPAGFSEVIAPQVARLGVASMGI